MSAWAGEPMLALDLEATGVDPDNDRIATACAAIVHEGAVTYQRDWTIAIDVDMPAEATAVNGLTTEHLHATGRPAGEVIPEIVAAIRWALVDACQAFGVDLGERAHEAAADAIAATRVMYRLAGRYLQIGDATLDDLHSRQIGWRREQCDSLRAYFDSKRIEHDGVDGAWPLRPYAAAAVEVA